MKFLKLKTLLLSSCLLLTSCSVLQSLYPLPTAQIPEQFAGTWTDKKKPSTAYCYPQTDSPKHAIWVIKPNENLIFVVGFEMFEILGYYSYSPTEFAAKAKEIIEEDEPETYRDISVKLLNKNTIQINGKTYYRCPKSPY
ncbi:hypothetical protein [Ursidibacter sp. B-7004-1]